MTYGYYTVLILSFVNNSILEPQPSDEKSSMSSLEILGLVLKNIGTWILKHNKFFKL